jgi:hypothetical protein
VATSGCLTVDLVHLANLGWPRCFGSEGVSMSTIYHVLYFMLCCVRVVLCNVMCFVLCHVVFCVV